MDGSGSSARRISTCSWACLGLPSYRWKSSDTTLADGHEANGVRPPAPPTTRRRPMLQRTARLLRVRWRASARVLQSAHSKTDNAPRRDLGELCVPDLRSRTWPIWRPRGQLSPVRGPKCGHPVLSPVTMNRCLRSLDGIGVAMTVRTVRSRLHPLPRQRDLARQVGLSDGDTRDRPGIASP
jgi:hypothetical protein